MSYRPDPDLEFLEKLESAQLHKLVRCLTHDDNNEPRLTEALSSSTIYKTHYPDHHQYWQLIAAELQSFGANTLATAIRGGQGVFYQQILKDVCEKLQVRYATTYSTEVNERSLMLKMLAKSLENMNVAQQATIAAALDFKASAPASPAEIIKTFEEVFRTGGSRSHALGLLLANFVAPSITETHPTSVVGLEIGGAMSLFAGPLGLLLGGLWAVLDIASPAYRVSIPAVLMVSILRQHDLHGELSARDP